MKLLDITYIAIVGTRCVSLLLGNHYTYLAFDDYEELPTHVSVPKENLVFIASFDLESLADEPDLLWFNLASLQLELDILDVFKDLCDVVFASFCRILVKCFNHFVETLFFLG